MHKAGFLTWWSGVRRTLVLALAAAAPFVAPATRAECVTAAWNPSPDPTVVGYNLYYGGASQSYTNMVALGNLTSTVVTGLLSGDQLFFAVTAVNDAGLESAFSNEVAYQVPGAQLGPVPPPVTWPSLTNIVYGTALGAAQLDASSSVPGSFSYNSPAGTVLNAGSQVLSVTFNPADTSSYLPVTINVALLVVPNALTITAANVTQFFGAASPALTASYTGFVNGDTLSSLATLPTLSTTATPGSPVGNYPIQVSGAVSPNYAINFVSGTLTILPAATLALVTSSANPSLAGAAVTFTAALSAVPPGAGAPTGTVQFIIDGAVAGAPAPLTGAAASYTTSALGYGAHTVAAQYFGDGNFTGTTNLLAGAQVVNSSLVSGPCTVAYGPVTGAKLPLATLLSSASQGAGNSITLASIVSSSANGGSVSSRNGWIFYVPPPGLTNGDSFTYAITDGRTQVPGTVTLTPGCDDGSSANLTIGLEGDGSYAINGSGVPGRLYQLQFTDGSQWQVLGQVLVDPNGCFAFIDPSGSPHRRYRSLCL